jgi:hypothetical protein
LKKTIILLILLALTLTALTILPPPSVKAASTSEATVLSYSWYIAPANTATIASATGDLIIVGEVQNVGSRTISNITVQGTAYSSTGQALATAQSEAFVYNMAVEQKAPFYIDFTAQSSSTSILTWTSQVSNVTVTVISVTDTATIPYTGVKVISDPINTLYDPDTGTYIISGTIENTGNQAVAKVWAVVTFYDSSGTVVGLNYTEYLTPYPSLFKPGTYTFFKAIPSDCTAQLASKISTFNVVIDAQTSSQSTNPQTTPTSTATPTTSNAQFPTLAIVVIIVIVIAVVAGLMLLLKKRQKPQTTPAPSPQPTDFQI